MSVSLRVKHSFSKQHYKAAQYFAQAASQLESSHTEPAEIVKSNHRAYVTGAILSSVAALEASINELYLEALDRNKDPLSGLTDSEITDLSKIWGTVERQEVLEKYQEALKCIGRMEFDPGVKPYQYADSLVYLRNALVHYKPEWDDELKVHAKIESRLKRKFPPNTFTDITALWFPHQCLGAGCALWSAEITEALMTEFCIRMGIPYRF